MPVERLALVRWTGNDAALLDLARKNALALSCGHCFIIFMSSGEQLLRKFGYKL